MSAVIPRNKSKKRHSAKFDNLIGPTDPKIDYDARERMVLARIGLLLRHSFFGNLATRLKLVNADEWCSTAATDGFNMYYNSKFIMMLKPKEVEFLFGHELLHCCYIHLDRRVDRDPQIWNIACDYAVNADLKRHKVGQFITTVPALYEQKYDGMAAELIYDDLMKNATKISIDDLLDQMIDDHLEGDGDGGEGEGDKDGKGGKRPKISQEDRDRARQEMKEAILNAAQAAEAGSLPAGIERMVKDMTEPVMPWNELIQAVITSTVKTDYSWMRPSRKGWHMDAILPAQTPGEEIDISVALDMSGSIGAQEIKEFLGEISGMMQSFDGYKIKVFSFDTKCYNEQTFTSENLDTIDAYQPVGGGGTSFECIFDYLQEQGDVPKQLIVFTDMLPGSSWGDPEYCDTTWIGFGKHCKSIVPPFGLYAYYD